MASKKVYCAGWPDHWDFVRMAGKFNPIEDFDGHRKKVLDSFSSKLSKLDDPEKYRRELEIQEVYRFTGWYLVNGLKDELLAKNKLHNVRKRERGMRRSDTRQSVVHGASKNPFLLGYELLFPTNDTQEIKNRSKWAWRMAYSYEHDIPYFLVFAFAKSVPGSYAKIKESFDNGAFEPLIPSRAKHPLRKLDTTS